MFTVIATSQQSSMSNKESGTMNSTGRNEYLSPKVFKIHRKEMFIEIDKIVEERDRLQDTIKRGSDRIPTYLDIH
jgi:hypothetical protein